MGNEFLEISGFPGYEINEKSEVQRTAFVDADGNLRRSRTLSKFYNNNNNERPLVQLNKDGKNYFVAVAEIMADTYLVENWKNDFVIRYRDLNSNNTELSNIYLYPKPLDVFERRQESEAMRVMKALS